MTSELWSPVATAKHQDERQSREQEIKATLALIRRRIGEHENRSRAKDVKDQSQQMQASVWHQLSLFAHIAEER